MTLGARPSAAPPETSGASGGPAEPAGTSAPPDHPDHPDRPESRARRTARFLRLWYGRVLVALAGIWLVYAVIRWLVSGRWHWSMLLDAAPPLFLVSVPALLLLAAAAACGRRRPWAAGLALPALLLGLTTGSGINWPALWRDQQPVPPGALHVVSLNTQYWAQATSVDRLYDVLHRRQADVYLLQEHVVWDPDLGEEGYSRLDDDARLRAEFPDYHMARQGELLTLSRYPIVAQPPVGPGIALDADPSTTFEQTFDRDKVLRTDLRVGEEILSVYNVHVTVQIAPDLSPFSDEVDYDAYLQRKFRWRQEEIRGLEEDITRNDHPMVIGGDFNCTAAMRDLNGVRDLAGDAVRASTDFVPLSWKFPAPAGFEWDSVFNRPLPFWRVDWAFTAGGVDVHRYEFLPTDGVSEHRLQDLWVSL